MSISNKFYDYYYNVEDIKSFTVLKNGDSETTYGKTNEMTNKFTIDVTSWKINFNIPLVLGDISKKYAINS